MKGPRLTDLLIQNASYGQPIARVWGQVAIAGNLIWQRPLKEVRTTKTQSSGGKGGSGPSSKSVTYSYYGRFAVGVCEGPIASFGRIWADGKLIRDAGGGGKYNGYFTFYTGTETQAPDPTMQAYEGVGATPAYRGLAYVVATDLPLADFGNRIPNLKIEVITKAGATAAFDSEFVGKSTYLHDTYVPRGDGVFRSKGHSTDKYGNYILVDQIYGGNAVAVRPDLSIAWSLSVAQMADLIDAFTGTSTVAHTVPDVYLSYGWVSAVGAKLIMTFQAYLPERGHFYQYVAVLEPTVSGTPAVLGFVRYDKVVWGAPTGGNTLSSFSIAGNQTEDDPLLLLGWRIYFDYFAVIVVLPSINSITAGAYDGGWGPTLPPYNWQAYEVPYLVFDPLGGSTSFNAKLYRLADWNGNTNVEPGFCLPLLDLSNPSTPIYRTRGTATSTAATPSGAPTRGSRTSCRTTRWRTSSARPTRTAAWCASTSARSISSRWQASTWSAMRIRRR